MSTASERRPRPTSGSFTSKPRRSSRNTRRSPMTPRTATARTGSTWPAWRERFSASSGYVATIDAAKAAPPPSPLAPVDLTEAGQVTLEVAVEECGQTADGLITEEDAQEIIDQLVLKLTNPEGKNYHVAAAFPSACGKTNLAMITPTIPGWSAEGVGVALARLVLPQAVGNAAATG